MNYCALVLLFFITSQKLLALDEVVDFSGYELTKELRMNLEKIKEIPSESYPKHIEGFRKEMFSYIEKKSRVCNGEFSVNVLSDNAKEETPGKRMRLSKEERVLCFKELKGFQVTFVNYLFEARKKYLDYLHEERLKQLALARENMIKSLQRGNPLFR